MPKLAAKMRKEVEKAESVSGDFEPLKPGKYVATLAEVEATKSNAGNPMWSAVFEDITTRDGEKQPGRQWYNLNLPTTNTPPENYEKGEEKWVQYQELCKGRLKSFFEAFGFTVDSDTDEMIGEKCLITVGIRTIQSGERAGEKTNSVSGVKPLSGDEDLGDDDGDEDNF